MKKKEPEGRSNYALERIHSRFKLGLRVSGPQFQQRKKEHRGGLLRYSGRHVGVYNIERERIMKTDSSLDAFWVARVSTGLK